MEISNSKAPYSAVITQNTRLPLDITSESAFDSLSPNAGMPLPPGNCFSCLFCIKSCHLQHVGTGTSEGTWAAVSIIQVPITVFKRFSIISTFFWRHFILFFQSRFYIHVHVTWQKQKIKTFLAVFPATLAWCARQGQEYFGQNSWTEAGVALSDHNPNQTLHHAGGCPSKHEIAPQGYISLHS